MSETTSEDSTYHATVEILLQTVNNCSGKHEKAISGEGGRSGEMAQLLRTLAALEEDLGSLPSIHESHKGLQVQFGERRIQRPLLDFKGTALMWYTYKSAFIHTHTILHFFFFLGQHY